MCGAGSTGPHDHFSFHLECNREHYTEQRRGLTILGGELRTNGRKTGGQIAAPEAKQKTDCTVSIHSACIFKEQSKRHIGCGV